MREKGGSYNARSITLNAAGVGSSSPRHLILIQKSPLYGRFPKCFQNDIRSDHAHSIPENEGDIQLVTAVELEAA